MRRRLFVAMSALLLSSGCGSSSDNGTTGPNNNNHNPSGARSMSAKVDGVAWTATAVGAGITNGIAIVSGATATQGVTISFVPTTGTQTITPTGIVIGSVIVGGQMWQTNGTGGSGTVTVTSASATRVVGTFSFTAPPFTGNTASPARQVTAGTFDVTF